MTGIILTFASIAVFNQMIISSTPQIVHTHTSTTNEGLKVGNEFQTSEDGEAEIMFIMNCCAIFSPLCVGDSKLWILMPLFENITGGGTNS